MKVVIAIDSFKGSLSSMEAGHAAEEGIKRADESISTIVCPLADGGEGTVEALAAGSKDCELRKIAVTGPLGETITCSYGMIKENCTAVLEMAGAAGLTLVPVNKRNPLYTTTYGVGEVIKDAISNGCRRFIVGIGGSATNDGGIGMLQALGYDFLDGDGNSISRGAIGLGELVSISDKHVIPELKECIFRVACDVTNPLYGNEGCSAVFAPQKGATKEMIQEMDQWMKNYADLAKEINPYADPHFSGAGAAGGLGFAFRTFTNAVLESGIQIVLDETRLEDKIKKADLVITGEGKLDEQTAMGKAPVGVAKLAKKYNIPVIAFAGSVTQDAKMCNQEGIDAFFPVLREITTLEEAMEGETAKQNMTATAEQVMRLFLVLQKTLEKN